MFRKMRRIKNELSDEDTKQLLRTNRRAALSVVGEGGYPYAVPINFYYDEDENRIYFHSAKKGYKIDSLKANNKVCFTSWNDGYLDDGDWAYRTSSVIVFGRAVFIEDRGITEEKLRTFAHKYYPSELEREIEEQIERDIDIVRVIAIDIEHMSGKKVHEK